MNLSKERLLRLVLSRKEDVRGEACELGAPSPLLESRPLGRKGMGVFGRGRSSPLRPIDLEVCYFVICLS